MNFVSSGKTSVNRIHNLKKSLIDASNIVLYRDFAFSFCWQRVALKKTENYVTAIDCNTKLWKFNIGFPLLPAPCFPYLEAGNCLGINPSFFVFQLPKLHVHSWFRSTQKSFFWQGILNQLNSHLWGHLSSNHFKVFSELVLRRLQVVTEQSHLSVWLGGATWLGQAF